MVEKHPGGALVGHQWDGGLTFNHCESMEKMGHELASSFVVHLRIPGDTDRV